MQLDFHLRSVHNEGSIPKEVLQLSLFGANIPPQIGNGEREAWNHLSGARVGVRKAEFPQKVGCSVGGSFCLA